MARDPLQIQNQETGGWNNSTVGSPQGTTVAVAGTPPPAANPGDGGYQSQNPSYGNVPQQGSSAGQKGTGFVNLSTLIGLNQRGGAQMGADLANSVGNQASQAQKEASNVYNNFAGQVQAGYQRPDLDQFYSPYQNAQNFVFNHDVNNDKKASTKDEMNNEVGDINNQMTNLQNILNNSKYGYQGPSDWTKTQGYDQAAKDLTAANQRLTSLSNPGGIQAALQQQYGTNNAQSALDSLFVGNNQDIQNVQKQFNAQPAEGQQADPFHNLSALMGYYAGNAGKAVQGQNDMVLKDQADAQREYDAFKAMIPQVQGTYDPNFPYDYADSDPNGWRGSFGGQVTVDPTTGTMTRSGGSRGGGPTMKPLPYHGQSVPGYPSSGGRFHKKGL